MFIINCFHMGSVYRNKINGNSTGKKGDCDKNWNVHIDWIAVCMGSGQCRDHYEQKNEMLVSINELLC